MDMSMTKTGAEKKKLKERKVKWKLKENDRCGIYYSNLTQKQKLKCREKYNIAVFHIEHNNTKENK